MSDTKCKTCGKSNHPTAKCHFNCKSCAATGVYHSTTYDCPTPAGVPHSKTTESKTAKSKTAKSKPTKTKAKKAKPSPVMDLITELIEEVEAKIDEIDEAFEEGDEVENCSTCVVDLSHSTCVCEYRDLLNALEAARDDDLF